MAASSPSPLAYSPGLEGIVAGETAVSTVEDGLRYRGYAVGDLCRHATFDEAAYLLLHGDLPNAPELQAFHNRVAGARQLPPAVLAMISAMPEGCLPLDVLRTAVSMLAAWDPEAGDDSPAANRRKAERLLAWMPLVVSAHHRLQHGLPMVEPRADLSHSANFLYSLRGAEASPQDVRALDVSLILYAEHEFNASTFTARVVVSTQSDLYSGVVGAIGALKGPLHGGANEKVMDVLTQAGGPATAEAWITDALARKARIMGFGHRVYKAGDVRAGILKEYAQAAATTPELKAWEDTAAIIERVMAEQKTMYPNLDWPAGRLYHAMDLAIPLYTPMFAMSRVAGWAAHIIEQTGNNRLIRPRSIYTGPAARAVKPLAER
jgi:citrate synthase